AGFMELLFEVVSAFGTVGLTLGITSGLSFVGKVIIIILMFIGRLGIITMSVALMLKQEKEKLGIQYPEEKVMVG
ncbi:MAG: potassium transporter TrkG, partial [Cellulosilyticaceae bacterium]